MDMSSYQRCARTTQHGHRRRDWAPFACYALVAVVSVVVQGADDTTAPVADSRRLVANLTAAGADASMHEVAGAGHGFTTPATAWPDAEKAMFDWLNARGMGK
jgi:acetyl esterase/lipase